MKGKSGMTAFYVVAGLYDGLLGLVFLFAWEPIFRRFAVTPPNHPGYIQFPALLLVIFGLMFLAVARDPARNRNLIPYGVLLKAAYCGTVFWHWVADGIPGMWKPFAWADLVFGILFAWSYVHLGKSGE